MTLEQALVSIAQTLLRAADADVRQCKRPPTLIQIRHFIGAASNLLKADRRAAIVAENELCQRYGVQNNF